MATITFRTKVFTLGETQYVKKPKLSRSHCDMQAFSRHPKLGSYSNSTLFLAVVERAVRDMGVPQFIRLDQLPQGVKVDQGGFLATVTINIP